VVYGAATALERGEQAVNQRRLCDDDSAVASATKWVSCSGAECLYIEKGVAPSRSAPASAT